MPPNAAMRQKDNTMRPQELQNMLAVTIKNNLPVLIKGAPGIGKTDIVLHATDDTGANVVLMHPVVSDPTDFKGLPGIVDGKAQFLPFGELNKLITAKTKTVAFMDDLGQAPAVVQAAAMQLILARQINGHKISDNVVFIAATNRREDRAGVTSILEPVKSRFATIVELEPNVEDWCEWALDNDVPQELVAFIRFRPALLLNPGQVTNDIVNRPSPRTITNLGRLFSAGLESTEVLRGAAGEGFAAEFVAFLRIFRQIPDIDDVIQNPTTAPLPTDPAARYAVITAVASRTDKDTAGRIITYLGRFPDEYSVFGIRDALRKDKTSVAKTKEYSRWAIAHQDMLV